MSIPSATQNIMLALWSIVNITNGPVYDVTKMRATTSPDIDNVTSCGILAHKGHSLYPLYMHDYSFTTETILELFDYTS